MNALFPCPSTTRYHSPIDKLPSRTDIALRRLSKRPSLRTQSQT